MRVAIEKISAVTLRVSRMKASVAFYRDVLGMEVLYGGEDSGFSSLRAANAGSAILNLELGKAVTSWGRLIFHVADVDAVWEHMTEMGFEPERPRDAPWGERYFHLLRSGRSRVVVRAAAAVIESPLASRTIGRWWHLTSSGFLRFV